MEKLREIYHELEEISVESEIVIALCRHPDMPTNVGAALNRTIRAMIFHLGNAQEALDKEAEERQ